MQTGLDCHRSLLYNYLGVSAIVVANEGKSPGSASSSFTGDVDVSHITVLLKQRLQVLWMSPVREVVNPEGNHVIHVIGRSAVFTTFGHDRDQIS